MSGGTPTAGGGYMRQRHSQGYASSGDDLEDGACSKMNIQADPFPRNRTWGEVIENLLWIASTIFIVYYGDSHSNLVYILLHDDRIRRMPLYLGIFGVSLNVGIFLYTSMLVWGVRYSGEKLELSTAAALPYVTILGLISFCLFSYALWPIWSFLTLPLMFTLFMACMVILPYLLLETFQPQSSAMLRTD